MTQIFLRRRSIGFISQNPNSGEGFQAFNSNDNCVSWHFFFQCLKAALNAFSEMALEEDQKHLFEKCFNLMEELVLAGHKVISELIFPFTLLGN